MRIGEFAKLFDKKKSTIRHYTEMRLIIPDGTGSYPEYNEDCIKDMEKVLNFISLGLRLEEIKNLIAYERLYITIGGERTELVEKLFDSIISRTEEEYQEVQKRLKALKSYRERLKSSRNEKEGGVGTSIYTIDLLCCPECFGEFSMNDCRIEKNNIISGDLICKCGEHYVFKDGIFMPFDECGKVYNKNKGRRFESIEHMMDFISPDVLMGLKKAGYKIDEDSMGDCTIFLGADTDIIIANLNRFFRDGKRYIFCSSEIQTLLDLKREIANIDTPGNFMFVLSGEKLPIKRGEYHIIDNASIFLEMHLGIDAYQELKSAKGLNGRNTLTSFNYSAPGLSGDDPLFQYLDHEYFVGNMMQSGYEVIHDSILYEFDKPSLFFPEINTKKIVMHKTVFK